MDRPKHWGLVLSGLTLMAMSSGCRSTRSKIPPEPNLGAGAQTQAQFSSDPPPATGPAALNANMRGGGNGPLPGQAPGGTHNDVPMTGIGTPTPQVTPLTPPPFDSSSTPTTNPNPNPNPN